MQPHQGVLQWIQRGNSTMKKWQKNDIFKKLISLAMVTALVFSLAACGGKDAGNEESGSGGSSVGNSPEFVYVPEFLTIGDSGEVSLYDTYMVGEDLYYTSYNYDAETGVSSTSLIKWSLTEGTSEEMPLALPDNANMNSWTVGADGCVYALLNAWSVDENGEYESSDMELTKFDVQGSQVLTQNVQELLTNEEGWISGREIEVDAQGRVYILGDEEVWLFDEELKPVGTVDASSNAMTGRISSWGRGADGKIYVVQIIYGESESKCTLSEIDFESKRLGEGHEGFPISYNGGVVQDAEGNFWTYSDTTMYKYDPETQEKENVFTWLESNINGDSVRDFSILPDGRIMLVYMDWQSDDSGVALLTKTDASEVVQKQQIVIATMYMSQELQAAAVNFNKTNDTYQIVIRTYVDQDSWSENAYADARVRLNNDITSGNCPDIIDLSSVNASQLAAKGVFEDLSPYLDKSTVLDRENMFDSVLNAYTYDGVLVSVPDSFELQTIIGSTAQVGDQMGWTLEEMVAFADAHPGQDLFDDMSKETMMYYLLGYNMDSFVDWNEGTCNFDSQEFKSLLEFVSRYPDRDAIEWYEDKPSTPTRIQNDEVLLINTHIYELDDIQLYVEMFKGDVTPIGFPNGDGNSGCILMASGCYAITTKSEMKDGAWEFIEQYLTRENPWMRFGFPNSRSELDKMAEEMLRVEYVLDENGEPMLDENGEPMIQGGSHGYGWGDFYYDFRKPTKEEVDMVLELIEVAVPASSNNEQLMEIINEEAAPFFHGQKSADEAAKIIQSRMQIYVSENS